MDYDESEGVYARIRSETEPTAQEEQELRAVIHSPLMFKLLRRVLEEAENKDSLSASDLSSEEGLKRALGKQGEVRGMKRAIEIMLEVRTTEGAEDAAADADEETKS